MIVCCRRYAEKQAKRRADLKIHIGTRTITLVKGIGYILFLKNGLKKICRKNYKNHPRSNNYEVCTAIARCFPNILEVMALENVNLSEDKIG
jgi:hypothetical protein